MWYEVDWGAETVNLRLNEKKKKIVAPLRQSLRDLDFMRSFVVRNAGTQLLAL